MNIARFFSVVLIFSCFSIWSKAQITIAVSKNENGSSVKYSIQVGENFDLAYSKAQKALEDENLKNVFVLKSTENTGHELKSGQYVLIISSRKNFSGKFFVSYGLGVSQKSKQEAIERAITHLKEHDWGYEKGFQYAIEKEGKISDFYPSEEEENEK